MGNLVSFFAFKLLANGTRIYKWGTFPNSYYPRKPATVKLAPFLQYFQLCAFQVKCLLIPCAVWLTLTSELWAEVTCHLWAGTRNHGSKTLQQFSFTLPRQPTASHTVMAASSAGVRVTQSPGEIHTEHAGHFEITCCYRKTQPIQSDAAGKLTTWKFTFQKKQNSQSIPLFKNTLKKHLNKTDH